MNKSTLTGKYTCFYQPLWIIWLLLDRYHGKGLFRHSDVNREVNKSTLTGKYTCFYQPLWIIWLLWDRYHGKGLFRHSDVTQCSSTSTISITQFMNLNSQHVTEIEKDTKRKLAEMCRPYCDLINSFIHFFPSHSYRYKLFIV